MIDPTNQHKANRPLSEISHLFLSSLREQAGADRARPVRIPPGGANKSQSMPTNVDSIDDAPTRKRVTAVIGAHLGGSHLVESALAYAASLASDGYRVGMLCLDASEFRIQLVECGGESASAEPEVTEQFDDRQMTDGLHELNHDVDRWLLVMADQRRPEARALLSRCDDWTMVGTCDHDGIVGGYRTLKGLAEAGGRSPLAIAFTDANDDEQAARSFAKLAAVCRQFLDWDVAQELLASDVEDAQAHTVLWCRGTHDKGQLANAPQWRVTQHFLELTPDSAANAAHFGVDRDGAAAEAVLSSATEFDHDDVDPTTNETHEEPQMIQTPTMHDATATIAANQPMSIPPIARPIAPAASAPAIQPKRETVSNAPVSIAATFDAPPAMSIAPAASAGADEGDVIELPDGVSVLSAVLRSGTQLLATPIAPPMCPGATVTVGRDRGLVLVAQAGTGLAGLDSIAAAVRWLDDSKQLIAMAMPQLSVDASAPTRVELLIDHADRTADGLRPLLGNSRITIRTYRKLRWAGRTGLLLDAA